MLEEQCKNMNETDCDNYNCKVLKCMFVLHSICKAAYLVWKLS